MDNLKIGFIGCGNLSKSIMKGIIKTGKIKSTNILVSDSKQKIANETSEALNVTYKEENVSLATESDVIFLCVKPKVYKPVIKEIRDYIDENTIIISVAPSHSLEYLENLFKKNVKIARTMPNTPAFVGEGMTAVCFNEYVTKDESLTIIDLLQSFGMVGKIEENIMDAVVSVSGSAPAYVFIFIEAMADAAVLLGMPREMAYKFAAQAVLGSAKMVLETEMHPGALKDMVCSPGGTTIEAVATLEKNGFRSTVISAMNSCAEKTKQMRENEE